MSDNINFIENLMWQDFINNKIADNTLHIDDVNNFYRYDVGFNSSDWIDNNEYEIGFCENNILWDNILYYVIQNKLFYNNNVVENDKYSKINYFISVFGSRLDWNIIILNTKIYGHNIYDFSGVIFYQSCEDILIKNQTISNEFIEEYYTYFIYEDLFKYQQISEDTITYILSNHDNDYFSKEVWMQISLKQSLSKLFIKKYIRNLYIIIIMNTNADIPIKYLNNILKNIHKKKCYKFDNIIKDRIKPYIVRFWIKKYRKHKHLNIKKTLLKKNLPNEIINNVLRSYYK